VVRFVHDQAAILGQHTVLGRGICHQEGVVDHDHVGCLSRLARPVKIAASVQLPLAPVQRAPFAGRGNLAPHRAVALERQRELGLIARLRLGQPTKHADESAQLVVGQGRLAAQCLEALGAQVITAALQQCGAERLAPPPGTLQHALQIGQVLAVELVLEVDGVGADDDAIVVLGCVGDGRQEICDRLARACARLDHEMVPDVEGFSHGLEHLHLLGPVLIGREQLCKDTARLEHGSQFLYIHRLGLVVGTHRLGALPGVEQGARRDDLFQGRRRRGDATQPCGACRFDEHLGQGPRTAMHQPDDLSQDPLGQQACALAEDFEELRGDACIVERAVLRGRRDAEVDGQAAEAVGRPRRDQDRSKLPRVQALVLDEQALGAQEPQVEADVVAHDRGRPDESFERHGDPLERGFANHILITDASDQCDLIGDRAAWVDERIEFVDRLSISIFDGADLDDGIPLRVQAGGFEVQRDVGARQRKVSVLGSGLHRLRLDSTIDQRAGQGNCDAPQVMSLIPGMLYCG